MFLINSLTSGVITGLQESLLTYFYTYFIHHLFDALLYIVIVILELSGTGISFKINKVLSYIILGVAQVMTLKHPRVLVL